MLNKIKRKVHSFKMMREINKAHVFENAEEFAEKYGEKKHDSRREFYEATKDGIKVVHHPQFFDGGSYYGGGDIVVMNGSNKVYKEHYEWNGYEGLLGDKVKCDRKIECYVPGEWMKKLSDFARKSRKQ